MAPANAAVAGGAAGANAMRGGVEVATRVGTPAEYVTFGFILGVAAVVFIFVLYKLVKSRRRRTLKPSNVYGWMDQDVPSNREMP